jgi:hypothetical protein
MNVQRYLKEGVSKHCGSYGGALDAVIWVSYPNFRTIHPEYVNGPMKYAPKYAPCKPPALAAVMLRAVWNLALSTSRRPYANPAGDDC